MNNHSRPTIGFITATIHTSTARVLWPGVVDAVRANDANLLCFPGGRLGVQADFESRRNVLYELVSERVVDGLVSWSCTWGGAQAVAP